MGNSISDEDEYPIIWYQPNFNSQEEKVLAEAQKSIHFFLEFEAMLKFCESLGASFLVTVPNDLLDEEKLLKEFEILKDTYGRRLTEIEEESILTGLLNKIPHDGLLKVYAFCTRIDFESEVLAHKEIRNFLTACKVEKTAYGFYTEFMCWEKNKEEPDQALKEGEMAVDDGDFLKCQNFCIKGLKELAGTRKREKLRVLYYANLMFCCLGLKKYKEAVQYSEEILVILRYIYGEGHTLTATSYDNVGTAYFYSENYQKSFEFFVKALDIRKALYGETHFLTASSYNNVAIAYNELGEHQIAIDYLLKSIEIDKSFLGETHSETLISITNLALVYDESKEYKRALEYYFKALEISQIVKGEKYSDLSKLWNNIAGAYESLKEYQKALDYYFKSLNLTISLYGEIHRNIKSLYRKIAEVYLNLGEKEKSLAYQGKSLFVKVALYGEMNAEIANLYSEIAREYENIERHQQAFDYYLKALKIYRVTNGEDHNMTETVYESVGLMFNGLQKYQKELIEKGKSVVFEKFLSEEPAGKRIEDERIMEDDVLFAEGEVQRLEGVENNHLLGKRSGPFEARDENFEPDVEKKTKQ